MLASHVQVSAWRLTDILGLFPGDRFSAGPGQLAERVAQTRRSRLTLHSSLYGAGHQRASVARFDFHRSILRVRSEPVR